MNEINGYRIPLHVEREAEIGLFELLVAELILEHHLECKHQAKLLRVFREMGRGG